MWPEWMHLLVVFVPSLVGAAIGLSLSSNTAARFFSSWLFSACGFVFGACLDLVFDPPLGLDPALLLAALPLPSAMFGLGSCIVVTAVWFAQRRFRVLARPPSAQK